MNCPLQYPESTRVELYWANWPFFLQGQSYPIDKHRIFSVPSTTIIQDLPHLPIWWEFQHISKSPPIPIIIWNKRHPFATVHSQTKPHAAQLGQSQPFLFPSTTGITFSQSLTCKMSNVNPIRITSAPMCKATSKAFISWTLGLA